VQRCIVRHIVRPFLIMPLTAVFILFPLKDNFNQSITDSIND